MIEGLTYYCDVMRHLVCLPYTPENLHRMAADLGIKRCWWHRGASWAHYDIPKRRIAEIQSKCIVVSGREILKIVKGLTKEAFEVNVGIAPIEAIDPTETQSLSNANSVQMVDQSEHLKDPDDKN